jgi:hypothetical protein
MKAISNLQIFWREPAPQSPRAEVFMEALGKSVIMVRVADKA